MPRPDLPPREAWGDLAVDPEVAHGYLAFGGKTVDEALPLFVESPIERAAELRFAPTAVFNYYVFCFEQHLLAPESRGESDMASCFLRLIRDRAQLAPAGLTPVWTDLRHGLEIVSGRQGFYEAAPSIYGVFEDIRREIETAYESWLKGSLTKGDA